MDYPLEGLRILELGIFHAGPGGSAILGDLGAEVIKIEQRGMGDPIRTRDRFGRTSLRLADGGTLFFEASNRNKQSITIDLNKDKGKEIVYRLIPRCDIFLTNLRIKAVEKLKMTYPILSKYNDQLIYASVSSNGPKGPDKDQGGFDFQGQARSGIMYGMGEPDMPPLLLHFALIDQVTAIIVSHAIMAALLMRERTGKGQEIQTSILGAALHLAYCNFLNALLLDQDVPRHHRVDTDPTRNYYCCEDNKWLTLTLQPNGDWSRFCQAINQPQLENDPRFDTFQKRSEEHSRELISFLEQFFLTKPRGEWLEILKQNDIFACPVNRATELQDDPQVRENYLDEIDHPSLGRIKIPGFPVRFSQARAGTRKTAPRLGEHNEEVLCTLGGYSKEEIKQFQEEEII